MNSAAEDSPKPADPEVQGESFEHLRPWLSELVWTAEEGIALLVGLRPTDVKAPAVASPPGSLDERISQRTRAVAAATSIDGANKSRRQPEYKRWKKLWDFEKDGKSGRPYDFISWAVEKQLSVPWMDWAEDNNYLALMPALEKSQTRVIKSMRKVIAGLCGLANIKPGERGAATQIRNECAKLGIKVSDDTVRNILADIDLTKLAKS